MRFNGLALVAAFAAMSACGGGGEKARTDTGAAAPAAGATTAAAPAPGAAAGTMAPVTGTWHEVKMLGDEKGYKFDPVDVVVKPGDGVRWIMVSGGPHNVAFQDVPAAARAQLSANMPNQISDLSSPMLLNPNEKYEMSFANIPAGKYNYICTPHIATGMKGSVTVQ
ncbi:MAG TPA: plastocyanin/azurin family copper-binding protein [Gemmatimonadaceae bacterium]|nr:plastocyanin/azurin family copper-binding protein [Gemmatimonadaceae bacterium]